MNNLKHWFVCLDLSKMDEVLIKYVRFLAEQLNPTTISFLHIIESDSISEEMISLFPQLKDQQEFEDIIREELKDKIEQVFDSGDTETRLIIKQGHPTDEIIEIIQSMDPDLLIMGKKSGYQGEGILAQKIVKYVPSSVLFVPETSRYSLGKILVPVDYSKQAATAVQTATEISPDKTEVYAQHIFRYPTHFFPYMPTEKDKEKVKSHLDEKQQKFKKEFEIPSDVTFIKSQLKKGRMADEIYNETVRMQIDMILMAVKGDKTLSSLLREDFSDKLINYSFGIPLFLLKNKKKHQKYLDAFTGS